MQVGSGIRFSLEFVGKLMLLLLFFSCSILSLVSFTESSSPCLSKMTKLSLTIKTKDVTSSTRVVELKGQLRWFRTIYS